MTVATRRAAAMKGARTRAKMRTARGGCAVVGCQEPRGRHAKCKAHRAEDNKKKKNAVIRREQESLMFKAGLSGWPDAPFPLPMTAMGGK